MTYTVEWIQVTYNTILIVKALHYTMEACFHRQDLKKIKKKKKFHPHNSVISET